MTDRELLELAAKAAGYWLRSEREPDLDDGKVWISDQDIDGVKYYPNWRVFDPLTDDVDALRLACHLECHVKHDFWARVISLRSVITFCQNPEKATRRDIVRAAAEIGKAMQ